jgi:adenine deaminase
MTRISGNIVDVLNSSIYPGTLEIKDGRIINILKDYGKYNIFIIPPLVDSHIHIESSMLVPSEFARIAVRHGTVAVVSDPHEIANVLGREGVIYMIEDGKRVPFRFYFGAPSCVPATRFETSGAVLGPQEVEELLNREEVKYLSEVMNFPGVINKDPEVMAKIELAKRYRKKIDGHAPGLRGDTLKKYVEAGISTDHETVQPEEALEKLKAGMKLQIREGSAARSFDALVDLIEDYPDECMFCSDDKHPDELLRGHINKLVKRALNMGYDIMKVLRAASLNPIRHYGLDVGLLQKGDYADFVIVDNLKDFNILETYIKGVLVSKNGETMLPEFPVDIVNNFKTEEKRVSEISVKKKSRMINVIEAIDGQLITRKIKEVPKTSNGYVVSDPERDILKIVVVNRYRNAPPAVGFIKSFGLKRGAIATSVAHDSHNLIAVGVRDEDIVEALNLLIKNKGGLAVVCGTLQEVLPLPVAGLMSDRNGFEVGQRYSQLDSLTKELGSTLSAPFMTLSFMALLVIPELKLSDKGLFDGKRFEFIDLFTL